MSSGGRMRVEEYALMMRSGISLTSKVNMTNCYRQRQRFFEKYESIDFDSLIAYWIMAGYLYPFESVHQAYEKGHEMLKQLTREQVLKFNTCRHEALCTTGDLSFDDFLDFHQIGKVKLTNGMLEDEKGSFLLVEENKLSSFNQELIASCKGRKYAVFYKSLTGFISGVLENVDNPSVLLFRDCNCTHLNDFSFEKLKTLTVLEISGQVFYSSDAAIFSALTQLQCLKLSCMVEELPEDCFSKLKQLRWLILRGCSRLEILPSLQNLSNLEVLDLSLCHRLCKITSNLISSPKLQMVDLSSTCLESIPQLETAKLTNLFLGISKLSVYRKAEIKHPNSLQVLDLSNSIQLGEIDLSLHNDLIVLDLSHTIISSLDSISDMVHLRKLILKGCACLQKLPSLEKLESLEVLDMEGCELITQLPDLSNLQKLEVLLLSGTQVSRLPSFANLGSLRTLSLKGLELDTLDTLASLPNIVQLDLSNVKISSSQEFKV